MSERIALIPLLRMPGKTPSIAVHFHHEKIEDTGRTYVLQLLLLSCVIERRSICAGTLLSFDSADCSAELINQILTPIE